MSLRTEQIKARAKEIREFIKEMKDLSLNDATKALNIKLEMDNNFVHSHDEYYEYSFIENDNIFEIVAILENNKIFHIWLNQDFTGSPEGDEVVVHCYYRKELFASRQEAMDFYEDCIAMSEGCERERYTNIYFDLKANKKYADDREYR